MLVFLLLGFSMMNIHKVRMDAEKREYLILKDYFSDSALISNSLCSLPAAVISY